MLYSGLRPTIYSLRRKPPSSSWLHKVPRLSPSRCFFVNPRLSRTAQIPPQSTGSQPLPRVESAENIKPEVVQKPPDAKSDGGPKTDALLTEQTVSNKEQRKADWAIMKEMIQYLWPKVWSLGKAFELAVNNRDLG